MHAGNQSSLAGALSRSFRAVAAGGIAVIASVCLTGCYSSYATPGKAADFSDLGLSVRSQDMTDDERALLTDRFIEQRLNTKPLASFPARIVFAQVQGTGYRWSGRSTYGEGNTTIVDTHHDPAMEEAIKTLSDPPMPGVTSLGILNSLLVPDRIRDHSDLRAAAANLQADMLLLYTFDTKIHDDEFLPYVGILTLGLFPDRVTKATSNASAILIDTRNGYVYGAATGIAEASEVSSFLGSSKAFDKAIKRVEADAMIDLVKNMRTAWGLILDEHAPQLAATDKTSG